MMAGECRGKGAILGLSQGYGGYRSGGIPGARAASNKAFSPDNVAPNGVFFPSAWI